MGGGEGRGGDTHYSEFKKLMGGRVSCRSIG